MNGDFVFATAFFYVVTLLSGLTLFWIGYLLFSRGVVEPRQVVTPPAAPLGTPPPPAIVEGTYGETKLKIENIAPGTVCFILGAILVGIGLVRGPQAISSSVSQAVKQGEARRDTELAVAMVDRSRVPSYQTPYTYTQTVSAPVPAPTPGRGPLSGESLKKHQERLQKELEMVNGILEFKKKREELVRKWIDGQQLTAEEKKTLQMWLDKWLLEDLPEAKPKPETPST